MLHFLPIILDGIISLLYLLILLCLVPRDYVLRLQNYIRSCKIIKRWELTTGSFHNTVSIIVGTKTL